VDLKINSKRLGKIIFWIGLVLLLVYTRLTNVSWGLPFPMHPDERNMAVAISRLRCFNPLDITNCFNPNFFAYGQLPLYLGYLLARIASFFKNGLDLPVTYTQAVISLRLISAFSSVLTVFTTAKIGSIYLKNKISGRYLFYYIFLLMIFSPYAIQFSHFGTTESLLMLFFSLSVFLSLMFVEKSGREDRYLFFLSVVIGLSIATKISSIVFFVLPLIALLIKLVGKKKSRIEYRIIAVWLMKLAFFFFISIIFALILSPHNIINFDSFFSAIKYESDVATGRYIPFYTRQFIDTKPFLFQIEKVFPYALGFLQSVLFLCGFLLLSYKSRYINFLRLAFLSYFVLFGLFFAKWTRFIAPVFPIATIFSAIYSFSLLNTKNLISHILSIFLFVLTLLPGVAYLSVYQTEDVRYRATKWINSNVKNNAYILQEAGNVVDIPLFLSANKNYNVVFFDFYQLEESTSLKSELERHMEKADYIIIGSRRVFANHGKSYFPDTADFYKKLFSGEYGFKKTAEITSYPTIKILGKKIIEFSDENAEETWTVFDHPVIRIYKRN